MPKLIKKVSRKAGLPPGTVVYVGKKRTEKVKIEVIDYTETKLVAKEAEKIEDCFPLMQKPSVTWINITGVYQTGVIEKIGKAFNLHPLTLEDITNTNQRPKIEEFDNYVFIVLRMLFYNEKTNDIESEQISFVVGQSYVISFQEKELDIFDPIRHRIANVKSKIRKLGNDYLFYSLIDAIVDSYFVTLEKIGWKIEDAEDDITANPQPETLKVVHNLKQQLILLRKSVWPLREVVNSLYRAESTIIENRTRIYFRDVYDHTIQVKDIIETYRDIVSGMLEIYLSSVSNKMNEVMKVLTIIATIFIPLTFLTSIYGMNFDFMPELGWKWSYPILWTVIITVTVIMLVLFKKRKWM